MKRIWLLTLVPNIKFGRWWLGVGLFAAMLLWVWWADVHDGVGVQWSTALFFCVAVSYIIPVFHYITERTVVAFDQLAPHLNLPEEKIERTRLAITHRSRRWIAVNLALASGMWVLQSRVLAGSSLEMIEQLFDGVGAVTLFLAPLLVWLTTTCAVHALVDNARLFRDLSASVKVDLLNPQIATPFGNMAVASTLMVIGSIASLGIMWLGGGVDPWTTIPGLVIMLTALVFLFLAPVWPMHRNLKAAKMDALATLQHEIDKFDHADYAQLAPLLAYRRELREIHEWPYDLGAMTRFGIYLIIVPLTWIGAALIENVVDLFVE